VASLARPGGNVTGLSSIEAGMSAKRLELLKEVVPGVSRRAFVWNPDVRGALFEYKETEEGARTLHLELESVEVSGTADVDRAFTAMTSHRAQAMILSIGNPVAFSNRTQIVSFTLKSRLPSIFPVREYVDLGGLMSYGPSLPAMYRRAATYVDKILKGAKPADLPVERPTKFDLVINMKTAKALGLTIPPSLLLRADEVINK
jgi:putative ABC transport system substrate-binding protein